MISSKSLGLLLSLMGLAAAGGASTPLLHETGTCSAAGWATDGQIKEGLGRTVAMIGPATGLQGFGAQLDGFLLAAGSTSTKRQVGSRTPTRGRVALFARRPGGGTSDNLEFLATLAVPETFVAKLTSNPGTFSMNVGKSLSFVDNAVVRASYGGTTWRSRTAVIVSGSTSDGSNAGALYVWTPEPECVAAKAVDSGAALPESSNAIPPWAEGSPAAAIRGCKWVLRQRVAYSEPTDFFGRFGQGFGEHVAPCEGTPLVVVGSPGGFLFPGRAHFYGWDEHLGVLRHVASVREPAGTLVQDLVGTAAPAFDSDVGQFGDYIQCDSTNSALFVGSESAFTGGFSFNISRVMNALAMASDAARAQQPPRWNETVWGAQEFALASQDVQAVAEGPLAGTGLGAGMLFAKFEPGSPSSVLRKDQFPSTAGDFKLGSRFAWLPSNKGCFFLGDPLSYPSLGSEAFRTNNPGTGSVHVYCGLNELLAAAHAARERGVLAPAAPKLFRARALVPALLMELPFTAMSASDMFGATLVASRGTGVWEVHQEYQYRAGFPTTGSSLQVSFDGIIAPAVSSPFAHRAVGTLPQDVGLLWIGAVGQGRRLRTSESDITEAYHTGIAFAFGMCDNRQVLDREWLPLLNVSCALSGCSLANVTWPSWSNGTKWLPPRAIEMTQEAIDAAYSGQGPLGGLANVPSVAIHELPHLSLVAHTNETFLARPFWEGGPSTQQRQTSMAGMLAAASIGLFKLGDVDPGSRTAVNSQGHELFGSSLSVALGQQRELGVPLMAAGSEDGYVLWTEGGGGGETRTREQWLQEPFHDGFSADWVRQGTATVIMPPAFRAEYTGATAAQVDGTSQQAGCSVAINPSVSPSPSSSATPSITASPTSSITPSPTPSAVPSTDSRSPTSPKVVSSRLRFAPLAEAKLSTQALIVARNAFANKLADVLDPPPSAGARALSSTWSAIMSAALRDEPASVVWLVIDGFSPLQGATGYSVSVSARVSFDPRLFERHGIAPGVASTLSQEAATSAATSLRSPAVASSMGTAAALAMGDVTNTTLQGSMEVESIDLQGSNPSPTPRPKSSPPPTPGALDPSFVLGLALLLGLIVGVGLTVSWMSRGCRTARQRVINRTMRNAPPDLERIESVSTPVPPTPVPEFSDSDPGVQTAAVKISMPADRRRSSSGGVRPLQRRDASSDVPTDASGRE
jgi:hypothetical protein